MVKMKVPAKPPVVLRELAADIIRGHVFTDRHLSELRLIPNVFMPIGLGGLDGVDTKSIGMIYARMDSAIKLALNGNPIFRECALLNRADADAVWRMVSEMNEAIKRVQAPAPVRKRRKRGRPHKHKPSRMG